MSGPKVDYAKLREQEMASLAEARGRRLKVADKIQKMINQIDSCLGGDVDLMLQDPQIGPGCTLLWFSLFYRFIILFRQFICQISVFHNNSLP